MGCASSSPAPYYPPPRPPPTYCPPVGGGDLCPCGNVAASMCGSVPKKCGLCCTGPCIRHGVGGAVAEAVPALIASIAPSAGGSTPLKAATASTSSGRGSLNPGRTKDLLAKELDDTSVRLRKPCKYGLKCYRKSDEHLNEFSHPDDDDYVKSVRKYNTKAQFATLKQCFLFCDPYQKGIIDDKELLDELITKHLQLPINADDAWSALDDDGNGFTSFPEFAEWASGLGDQWPGGPPPIGMDDGGMEGAACTFCRCKCFRPTGESGKFCKCGHKKSLHVVNDSSMLTSVPCYWEGGSSCKDLIRSESNHSVVTSSSDLKFFPCSDEVIASIQQMATASLKRAWTRDRGKDASGKNIYVPKSYEVVGVRRSENRKIWRKYVLKRMMIKESLQIEGGDTPPFEEMKVRSDIGEVDFMGADNLDRGCNEWFLWHGTSLAGARNICETDFRQSLAGTTTGTLYGPGTYFAESFTKADEYGKCEDGGDTYTMLLVRVVGGRVKYTDEAEPDAADLTEAVLHGAYDSVLGDREKCRNTFKEFVIFGSDQAYPEFIVSYKRVD